MLEITILRIRFSFFCERKHVPRPPKIQEALHPPSLLPLSNSQANIYWINMLLAYLRPIMQNHMYLYILRDSKNSCHQRRLPEKEFSAKERKLGENWSIFDSCPQTK